MKKFVSLFAIMLTFVLTSCSGSNTLSILTDNGEFQSSNIISLDEGIWPDNEYTAGLPVPSGTVAWAILDTVHNNCGINMTDISEEEFENYVKTLKQEGFYVVEDDSEKIEGEDYISIGAILSNDEKGLSISYIPGSLTIYIFCDSN